MFISVHCVPLYQQKQNIMEFKGIKWSLGGISGRMIKTNEYGGFIADVDTKKNALLISKAPEMLEMLNRINTTISMHGKIEVNTDLHYQLEKLIKEAKTI